MKEKDETHIIFDLTNDKFKYKGVLLAVMDLNDSADPFIPLPEEHLPDLLGLIYLDENDVWFFKARLKFSSGNKQVLVHKYGKNFSENEILIDVYKKLHLKDKKWLKNTTEDGFGIIELLKNEDMIEYIKVKQ